jgi:ATP-dependent helicase/nuclease subunit A
VPYFEERVWRWRPEAMEGAAAAAQPPAAAVELKPWLHAQLPASARLRRIVPSMILPEPFARERASAAGLLDARRRGDLIHRLLQSLPDFPAEERKERALRFLIHAASDLPAATRDELAAEAIAVLDHPDMAALLGPQSRAELDILARLPDFPASEIAGRIDRMVIRPDAVLIADFKTDANPPPGPEKANERYVAQLALYRAAVGRIYPGRPVRVFLVWTAKPAIHELPSERLDAALQCLAAA